MTPTTTPTTTPAAPAAPEPPLRLPRALVLACAAIAVGAASHALSGGAVTASAGAWALPVLALLAWPLTGRERGGWTIAGVQLAGQHAAHALFELHAPSHAATSASAGMPVDAWFYGHALAAVVLAAWLRHAERRTWAAARRAAAALRARWRRLLARLSERPAAPPRRVVAVAAAPPVALRRHPLRHSVVRRGPPLPA